MPVSEGIRSLFRDASLLALGTALGQAAGLIAIPVLTRLFTPTDFGIFTAYTAVVGLSTSFFSLKYELAVVLPFTRAGAANVTATALISAAVFTLLGTAVLVLLPPEILAVQFGSQSVAPYLIAGVLVASLNEIWVYWRLRARDHRILAAGKTAQGWVTVGAQGGMGFVGILGALALPLGDILGRGTSLAIFAFGGGSGAPKARDRVKWQRIKWAFSRFRRFAIFSTPAGLMNVAALQLVPLLFLSLYGTHDAGLFGLALRLAIFPTTLVGLALSKVFLQRIAQLRRDDPAAIRPLFTKVFFMLLPFGAALAGLLLVFAAWGIEPVLGSEWSELRSVLRPMSILLAVHFAVVPLSYTLTALELQQLQMYWDAGRLVLAISSVIVPGLLGYSLEAAVLSYSISMAIAYVALYLLMVFGIRHSLDLDPKAARP